MITQNTKLNNKLINQDYIASIKNVLDYIINTDDQKKAFELSALLERAVKKHKEEIARIKEVNDFYKKIIIKAKFIALPLLDNADVIDLVKNYFTWQFHIAYYDFLKKIENKLINIEVFEDRDQFKEEMKKALLGSELIITKRAKLRKINEWLRDYNSRLGINIVDNLKRTQYFIDLKKTKELDDHDFRKLKILFDFYEKLKLSSLTPQGFEEDIPIVIDGNFYIYKQGVLEPVGKEAIRARTVSGPPATAAEDKIQELKQEEARYGKGGLEEKAIEEEIEKEKRIEELRYMAGQYPAGSLERKAIEEEIRKLSSGRDTTTLE